MEKKTNSPEIWDMYQSEQRDGYVVKSGKNDPTFFFIKKLIKEKKINNKEILEIGYGDGGTLQLLANDFEKVYGADISPKNVEITKQEFEKAGIKNAEIFVLDLMERLPTDKTFDIVMLNHVLEHFTLEELNKVVPNLIRLLKPTGKLLGAVPYNLKFTHRVCPHCHTSFEIDGHQIKYTEDIFRKNFLHFGFKEILIRNNNFEFYSRNDNLLKKLMRRFYYKFIKTPKGQLEFCLEKNV